MELQFALHLNMILSILVVIAALLYIIGILKAKLVFKCVDCRKRSYFFIKIGYLISFSIYGFGMASTLLGNPPSKELQILSVTLVLFSVLLSNVASLLRNDIVKLFKNGHTEK